MEKKKFKQVAIGLVAAMALNTATVPSATALVIADELKQKAIMPNTTTIPTPTGREVLFAEVPLSEMILIDGVAYDSQGNIVVEQYEDSLKREKNEPS